MDEIPSLAFDHDRILRVAINRLKERICFEPIGFDLLPEVFTMSKLQNLYEAILEVKFDRRNFYNKMLKLGILSEAEPRPKNASRRTPSKYRFNSDKYAELKQKGFRLEF
jgi:8-oxo-dGTP diphosphatase